MSLKKIKEKYYSLLKNYFKRQDEMHLFKAAELGLELVSKKIPAEEIAEMHDQATQRLGAEYPEAKLLETAKLISAPLLEMLMAYGMAFRELLDERKQAEAELANHRDHLEELIKKRTSELEEKNAQLERFNKVFVGREFRIKELRDKVKELEKKLND